MPHAHDSDRPPAGHAPRGCDHDCQTCGASPVSGLAACPYCRAAYPGADPGVTCPGCANITLRGHTVCAQCRASLTRTCVFCTAATLLDQPQCARCHEPFAGAEERKRARGVTPAPLNSDPTGSNIFNTLNSILKS